MSVHSRNLISAVAYSYKRAYVIHLVLLNVLESLLVLKFVLIKVTFTCQVFLFSGFGCSYFFFSPILHKMEFGLSLKIQGAITGFQPGGFQAF